MKRFLLLALCALFAGTAGARTLYVDAKRPNNNGNGLSAKKAKKTIQAAINIAKKGDTILVYPGSYAPITAKNKKITIKSVKGNAKTKIVKPAATNRKVALAQLGKPYTVFIDTHGAKGNSGIYSKGTKTQLSGFLLDGMNRTVGSFGELIGVSGGTVKSCIIQRLGKRYADTFGGFASYDRATAAVNSSLEACIIRNNFGYLAPSEALAVGSGSEPAAETGSTFNRCVFQNNEGYTGIVKGSLRNCLLFGNTVRDELFDRSTLINCTVAKNTSECSYPPFRFSYKSKYYDCILWNNYVREPLMKKTVYGYDYYADASKSFWLGWRSTSETTFTVPDDDTDDASDVEVTEDTIANYWPDYVRVENSWEEPFPGKKVLHNVDAGNTYKNTDKTNKNPKFVNAPKGNYKLKKGSPFIDKGKLTAAQKKLVGSKDLAGKKRIRGKANDRGCYEY